MPTLNQVSIGYTVAGIIFIVIGLAVFAIRLTHPGIYALPNGVALIAAPALLLLSGLIMWSGTHRILRWISILLAVIAALPSIYSIAGESQEVISLYATDSENQTVDLRLWIVDREDGAWVGMGRKKAVTHNLDGARIDMLRNGEIVCVSPILHQDRTTVHAIHAMKVEKYKTAQIAGAIGLYPLEATPSTVVLRLKPCATAL